MRVLVTGGAGFIGSHLVERLVALDHDVLVLDNLSTGKLDNLRDFFDVTGSRFLNGDIRSYDACHQAVQSCEAVFHQAALGSVPRSVEDPFTTHEVNVTGTLNMLEASRRNGVERFVFASSSSVYGNSGKVEGYPVGVKTENQRETPLSPYGVSKLAAERYCRVWRELHGLQTTSLRYFNVFGPRQDPAGPYAAVVPRFVTACLRDEPMVIFGDGEQERDFTYVENVVEANLLALEHGPKGAYNIGCGMGISVHILATHVADACGKVLGDTAKVEFAPPRAGDVPASEAVITQARLVMKYRPTVSVADGMKRTVEWFQKQEKGAP
jgi:UDP-N-acetylglucosamine 4-epimerase